MKSLYCDFAFPIMLPETWRGLMWTDQFEPMRIITTRLFFTSGETLTRARYNHRQYRACADCGRVTNCSSKHTWAIWTRARFGICALGYICRSGKLSLTSTRLIASRWQPKKACNYKRRCSRLEKKRRKIFAFDYSMEAKILQKMYMETANWRFIKVNAF